jgi:hypothetical protein
MKGVLIVRQIMAKKEILLHRINQMSRISAFCDHLALINYASEIAPVGQAASQAPQSTQASASISYLLSPVKTGSSAFFPQPAASTVIQSAAAIAALTFRFRITFSFFSFTQFYLYVFHFSRIRVS